MNKTITVYELLGLVKDGKAPDKIKVFNYVFIYTKDKRPTKFYIMENQENYLLKDFVYTLNTAVEIIEDNDKLEKIKWNEKESRAGFLRADQEIEILAKRTET